MQLKNTILISFAALLMSVASYLYMDEPLAIWIDLNVRSHKLINIYTSDIPDLLLLSVIVLSTLSWAAYFYLKSRGIKNKHRVFFLITGIALPLSFIVKTLLKLVFGRIETRIWLTDHSLDGMHWFSGENGFDGFPSGHMVVFTTFFVGLWQFYPLYRDLYLVTWLGLAIALMLTNYHFLSDVIAGSYFGALICCSVIYITSRRHIGGSA
ncbi:MAG TPA: phosphatase PAP2 family protein [Methylophilaceae bacterium]|nr:phosphatase PAP2 family protein [Methylophilaceae bacterium]